MVAPATLPKSEELQLQRRSATAPTTPTTDEHHGSVASNPMMMSHSHSAHQLMLVKHMAATTQAAAAGTGNATDGMMSANTNAQLATRQIEYSTAVDHGDPPHPGQMHQYNVGRHSSVMSANMLQQQQQRLPYAPVALQGYPSLSYCSSEHTTSGGAYSLPPTTGHSLPHTPSSSLPPTPTTVPCVPPVYQHQYSMPPPSNYPPIEETYQPGVVVLRKHISSRGMYMLLLPVCSLLLLLRMLMSGIY